MYCALMLLEQESISICWSKYPSLTDSKFLMPVTMLQSYFRQHEHLSCTSRRHINHQCKPEPQYISSSDTCGISLSTTNGLAPQSFSSLSPVKVWGIHSSTEQFSTARSIHNPIVHAADSTQSSSLTKYTPKTLPVTTSPNRAAISSKKR